MAVNKVDSSLGSCRPPGNATCASVVEDVVDVVVSCEPVPVPLGLGELPLVSLWRRRISGDASGCLTHSWLKNSENVGIGVEALDGRGVFGAGTTRMRIATDARRGSWKF